MLAGYYHVLFNSYEFLIFFPLVALLFWLLPQRAKTPWLLVASCVFYGWLIPVYLTIMAVIIVVDYCVGLQMVKMESPRARRWFLGISLASNVGLLAVFKYYNFANGNLTALADWMGWQNRLPFLEMALPIGLSFHTFQAMSYIFEVYKKRCPVERNFLRYALYVMFFPQMVAGPIERPQNVLPQLRHWLPFDQGRVVSGLRRIMWGLVKKVLIADRLALCADTIFNHPGEQHGLVVLIGVYAFALQIYCDFSGYSDIAVGTARVLGVRLMENFRRPYFAVDLREFWQRWHISLSTWFRDYLYIPLGGNRGGAWKVYRNLLIVFVISGLWHGAAWTFIIWGALHGLGVIFSTAWRNRFPAAVSFIGRWPGILLTFHFVAVTWIFFRTQTLADAGRIFASLGQWKSMPWPLPGLDLPETLVAIALTLILLFGDALAERRPDSDLMTKWPSGVRWAVYLLTGLAMIFLSPYSGKAFIYFQF